MQPLYLTWNTDEEKARAYNHMGPAHPIVRGSDTYFQVGPGNTSIRDSFRRNDWDNYRPEEKLPANAEEAIRASFDAYDQVALVRNIIDLMGDFATQGIDLNHPKPSIQAFYKKWFKMVGGKERSERFLNLLYLPGNVVIRRLTATIPVPVERQMKKAGGAPFAPVETVRREIPYQYVFLHPLSLKVMGGELSSLIGKQSLRFAMAIPKHLIRKLQDPNPSPEDQQFIDQLPPAMVAAIKKGETLFPLEPEKTRFYSYKRNDWDIWASPMLRPLFEDLHLLKKMKLADLAALDGAISSIRVWKLGSLEHKLIPTEAAINRLAEMLCNNVGGGVMDLVWGPDLELKETSTEVYKFLGEGKYAPVLSSIYGGLGIPPTLTGSGGAGFTNNYISLKTLTERLQYGRDRLVDFWTEEIGLVQKAMGHQEPATLVFDRMALADEAAIKQLLINLADRDLISAETLQEMYGLTPEIEEVRTRREMRKREAGMLPPKASPFHDSQPDHTLKKIFVQTGVVTPSEVGVDLEKRKPGEKAPVEQKAGTPESNQSGEPGGRPKNSRDKTKRKQKEVQPRTSAFLSLLARGESLLLDIGALVNPAYLARAEKKSLRELSREEFRELEDFKFSLLCQASPSDSINEDWLKAKIFLSPRVPEHLQKILQVTLSKHRVQFGEPTLDSLRRWQAGVWAHDHLVHSVPEISGTGDQPAPEPAISA